MLALDTVSHWPDFWRWLFQAPEWVVVAPDNGTARKQLQSNIAYKQDYPEYFASRSKEER